jgi:hypothetical protein
MFEVMFFLLLIAAARQCALLAAGEKKDSNGKLPWLETISKKRGESQACGAYHPGARTGRCVGRRFKTSLFLMPKQQGSTRLHSDPAKTSC